MCQTAFLRVQQMKKGKSFYHQFFSFSSVSFPFSSLFFLLLPPSLSLHFPLSGVICVGSHCLDNRLYRIMREREGGGDRWSIKWERERERGRKMRRKRQSARQKERSVKERKSRRKCNRQGTAGKKKLEGSINKKGNKKWREKVKNKCNRKKV